MISKEGVRYSNDVRQSENPLAEEDLIAQFIREEVIKTWTLGKSLGLSHKGQDEEIIKGLSLLELDKRFKPHATGEKISESLQGNEANKVCS